MAKLERNLTGDFDALLEHVHRGLLRENASISCEDGSDYCSADGLRCAVRVYERYSMIGGNRVSLNLTLVGEGRDIFLSAITSGGSRAVVFKINTLGEGAFLDCVEKLLDEMCIRDSRWTAGCGRSWIPGPPLFQVFCAGQCAAGWYCWQWCCCAA